MTSQAQTYFALFPENCSGCLSCELACSFQHSAYFDRFKSRIRILVDEERSRIEIQQCIQCDERSCVAVCPTEALSVEDRLGYVVLDESLCTHCRKCFKACRYNGAFWDQERNLPLICDLCRGEPQCQKPCRLHQAIQVKAEARS